MQPAGVSPAPPRRRGRPVGADSAETRSRILKAARQVINQRGYQAATFQAIAVEADVSRPSVHHYFASREQIYDILIAEAGDVMAGCIAKAQGHHSVVAALTALLTAMHDAHLGDRSQIALLVTARLEGIRNPELRRQSGVGFRDFVTTLVRDAAVRGELPAGTAMAPVVDMLQALIWGMGFYAGVIDRAADMAPMTRQLDQLFSHGLPHGRAAADSAYDTSGDTPRSVVEQP